MTEITPTFDPSDCTWFTDDGIEAKSLAELQAMLPDVRITGYMPDGYGPVIRPRISPNVAKVSLTPAWTTRVIKRTSEEERSDGSPKVRAVPVPSKFEQIDWSDPERRLKLAELVARGLPSSQIAGEFNCTPGAIIGACNRLGYKLQGRSKRDE